jgi:hypothetical protein
VRAANTEIGFVDDFLFTETEWSIRYFVINSAFGDRPKHVVVPTDWLARTDWENGHARVDVTAGAVGASPGYGPDTVLTLRDEARLYQHYGRTFGR